MVKIYLKCTELFVYYKVDKYDDRQSVSTLVLLHTRSLKNIEEHSAWLI